MRSSVLSLWLVGFLIGCNPSDRDPDSPEFLPLEGGAKLPFSAAVRVGTMLYLSGQIGTDTTGRLVPGGIEAETRQTMENIKATVERGGSSMDRVVKCTAMLADMADWPAMNRVYVGYFSGNLPARSAFGASGLALGARVEIECWAIAPRRVVPTR
jgi:2-iminobutanoate/2-iminopropanoate deaminase